jgi:hypothetical protein
MEAGVQRPFGAIADFYSRIKRERWALFPTVSVTVSTTRCLPTWASAP